MNDFQKNLPPGAAERISPEEWATASVLENLAGIRAEYARMIRLIWATIGILAVVFVLAIGIGINAQRSDDAPIRELLEVQRASISPAAHAEDARTTEAIITRQDCANRRAMVEGGADPGLVARCPITGAATDVAVTADHSLPDPGGKDAIVPGAVLVWRAPIGTTAPVTKYKIARNGTDRSGYGRYETFVSGETRTFTFLNLRPGDVYTFTIQPVTDEGPGQETAIAVEAK